MKRFILSYDIGSTGCKTCLYEIDGKLRLAASALSGYELKYAAGGGVEQDPEDWWNAMRAGTKEIYDSFPGEIAEVSGISFCAQMQGLVLVDESLAPLRPAMSYLDQRAEREWKEGIGSGFRIEGLNARKLLAGLAINGAAAASVKDPVWKYRWVERNEPGKFARIHKWLDVKDYLIARATGVCAMTRDSAFATFLTGERKGTLEWNPALLSLYGVKRNHLPDIVGATAAVGKLRRSAASELGLPEGIPVFGGGGDVSMIAVGSGATEDGDCHIYTGTSGWVSCTVRKRKTDIASRIAAITGAQVDRYNFFAEQETAGKCLEWVRDHLAKDEIDLYLDKHSVVDSPESCFKSMYDFLIHSIGEVPPGSGGVVFTPWLHGNRSPFEDPSARGIFFNLSLETGKRAMIRAVVEGIIFHQRWLLESIRDNFEIAVPLRFAGGGALSPAMTQILCDILGLPVVGVDDPQNCGAAGAAFCAAIGLGWIPGFEAVKQYVSTGPEFMPDSGVAEVYNRQFAVFKDLYSRNRKLFKILNPRFGG